MAVPIRMIILNNDFESVFNVWTSVICNLLCVCM